MKIAFVDGTVITGDRKVIERGTVIVEGNRITKVGENGSPIPSNATKISLEGRTLLPGFIDCHVHLCTDGSPDPLRVMLSESPTITALKAANFAKQTLMGSICTWASAERMALTWQSNRPFSQG